MKTCNFREAQPRLFGVNNDELEGIFCRIAPVARYGMIPCRQDRCFLCQARRGESGALLTTPVQFSLQQVHQFVNKYEAILNCPAVS